MPGGCTLSVSNDQGHSMTKVKSQPMHQLINAGDLTLAINGPLSTFQAESKSRNDTQKLAIYGGFLTDHLLSVVQRMEKVDNRITDQATYIWSLVGIITVTIALVCLTAALLYRFSGRFRLKIYDLRDNFAELIRRISDVETKQDGTARGMPPMVAPRPALDFLLNRPRRGVVQSSAPLVPSSQDSSSSYLNLRENEALPRQPGTEATAPGSSSFRPLLSQHAASSLVYPRLSPLYRTPSDIRMDIERGEMEGLCNQKTSQF
jgi:hypothetical protein